MSELDRIKGNLKKMRDQGANDYEMDAYFQYEKERTGVTLPEIQQHRLNRTTTQNIAETAEDLGKAALTGLAELPLGATQRLTDMASAVVDEDEAKLPGIVTNVLSKFVDDPDVKEQLGQLTLGDLRKSQAAAAREIEDIQAKAGRRSPIAATTGEIASQIGQLAPVGAGASTLPQLVGAGTKIGAITGAAQTREDVLDPTRSLLRGFGGTAEQALAGGATAGLAKIGLDKGVPAAKKALSAVGRAPKAVEGQLQAGARKMFGFNPQKAKRFRDIGIDPNIAAVSDSPIIKGTANFLSKFPGGIKKFRESMTKAYDKIDEQLGRIATKSDVSDEAAGEIIKKGGERYLDKGKRLYEAIDNKFQAKMPKGKLYDSNNVAQLRQNLIDEAAGSEFLKKSLSESRAFRELASLYGDIQANNGALPYNVMKQARTKIRNLINDKHLVGNTETGTLKRLHAALTDDMRDAATAQGPEALKLFERGNKVYKTFSEELEGSVSNIINQKVPERIYKLLVQGTREGGTRVRSIMKNLTDTEKEVVRAKFFNDLGTKKSQFSVREMMNKYADMSETAKKAIMAGDPKLKKAMDKFFEATKDMADIDEFNKAFQGEKISLGALLSGIGIGAVGASSGLSTVGYTALTAYLSARLFTSPKFVNWLSKTINTVKKADEGRIPQILEGRFKDLSRIAAATPDIRNEVQSYLDGMQQMLLTQEVEDATGQ